jgi:hypothetical protein
MHDGVMNASQIILEQLGGRRFLAMTGAKCLLHHEPVLGVHLPRKPGFVKQGVNYIKISLSPLDLYDIEFGRIKGLDYKVIEKVEGVYSENLCEVISETTGLALSL